MYEKYISSRYYLKIGDKEIPEDSPLRLQIQRISVTIRRSGLSSLNIVFADPELQWRNYFTRPKPIYVKFDGFNFDGSAPERFEGYVYQISPMTARNMYDLEVECLSARPTLTLGQKKSTTYKKMSRKQVIQKLANESKAKVYWYTASELNTIEDELVMSINTSKLEFMTSILEEVGYRVCLLTLDEWIVAPMFSSATKIYGGTYTNLQGDTSLLDFQPTFSKYSYEEDEEKDGASSSTKTKTSIDPSTKKTTDTTTSDKPNNNPESKSGSSGNGGSGKGGSGKQMYYDTKTGQWKYT
jgi:hypothetical protein